jgi:putative membrane protein
MLTAGDRDRISAAVTAAETTTDGEIVTIIADRSDPYRDAALQWSVLIALLALAVLAAFPGFYLNLIDNVIGGGWHDGWTPREIFTVALFVATIKFLGMRLILLWEPLLLFLTPNATKHRRVRRRALMLFRVGIEQRTRTRTGILLYLSLAEHRAEIVADEAIHSKVAPELWGDAMATLIEGIKDKRAGDGMVAAIGKIGAVLAEHFARTGTDPDELPDRVIEL